MDAVWYKKINTVFNFRNSKFMIFLRKVRVKNTIFCLFL
jgi:hypothetical protein